MRPFVKKYGAVLDEQEKAAKEAAMSLGSDLYKTADSTVRQRIAKAVDDQTRDAMDSFTSGGGEEEDKRDE